MSEDGKKYRLLVTTGTGPTLLYRGDQPIAGGYLGEQASQQLPELVDDANAGARYDHAFERATDRAFAKVDGASGARLALDLVRDALAMVAGEPLPVSPHYHGAAAHLSAAWASLSLALLGEATDRTLRDAAAAACERLVRDASEAPK